MEDKGISFSEPSVLSARREEIRRQAIMRRDLLSGEERARGSLLMTERILGHQLFYMSDIFLCFVSFGSEIETRDLIKEALRQGKKVFAPKVTRLSDSPQMRFYRVCDPGELSAGYRGIMEPSGTSEEYLYRVDEAEKTMILMPGAAFDRRRNRLGYGKGFYDRFLADREILKLRSVAVGFSCQMVDSIPEREGDVRPSQVLCF